MPDDFEPLLSLMHQVNEARLRELDQKTPRCPDGPSLAALYLFVAENVQLPPEQVEHIRACPRCGRVLDQVRLHLEAGADGASSDRASTVSRAPARPATAGWFRATLTPAVRRWAIAALLLIGAGVAFWISTPTAMADSALARIAREALVAMQTLDFFNGLTRPPDDPTERAAAEAEIEKLQNRRDDLRRQAEQSPDSAVRARAADDTMKAWQLVCWGLRNIGEFDEALVEASAWVHFTEDCPSIGRQASWYHTVLDDVGSLHAARGDFASARTWYDASIQARDELRQRAALNLPDPVRGRLEHRAQSISPIYWRHFRLAILEGDLATASRWADGVEAILRDYYVGVCRASGRNLAADAPLMQAVAASPQEFQRPREDYTEAEFTAFAATHGGYRPSAAIVAQLRAYWVQKARLLLLQGDTASAADALRAAQAIRPCPLADDYRLDFALPLEVGRLAIIQGHYAAALTQLAGAEAHWGAYHGVDVNGAPVDRPKISEARRAELRLLRGLALLGIDDHDRAVPPLPPGEGRGEGQLPLPPGEGRSEGNVDLAGGRTPSTLPLQHGDGGSGARAATDPARRAEALALIRAALAIPESSINALPPARRTVLKRQLQEWKNLAEHVERNSK